MTTPTPEQIEAASQKDIIALMRSLKNAAYSHGVTDQTEYYSDKKYRVAYEKSEAAFEELRAAIASLQAEVEQMRVPLDRAFTKLRAYRGVCKDDKELDVVINLVRNTLAPLPEK